MNPNEIAQEIEEVVEEVEETEEVAEEEEETESAEDLKKKIATLQAQKEHWRKKATSTKEEVVEPTSTLSNADLIAVMNAKVHEDDMERVERFAKSENLSIKEALKNPELKAILSLREEQRTTASATNVTNVRRGSVKVTDESLIAKASAGQLPEDDDGINRLIAAKLKNK
jgi:hypothetical protein